MIWFAMLPLKKYFVSILGHEGLGYDVQFVLKHFLLHEMNTIQERSVR